MHILDTASGKLLPETIGRCNVGQVSWAEDSQSFSYNRTQKLALSAPATEKYLNSHVYLHVLGRNPDRTRCSSAQAPRG